MAIKTRETTATGVTNKGAPLTNAELDNNFVELQQNKVNTADLNEAVDDRVNNLFQAGLGIDLTYDDVNNEFTIDSNHVEVACTNNTGASIPKGTAVYQTGVSGNNITIAPADADVASKMPAIGLTTSAIADTAEGTIVILGVVDGLDTSAYAAGDTLYVSTTAGGLSTVKPTGETGLIQNFGRVLKVNASSGAIAVMGAGRSNAVPNLNDGNVFIGNASNQAEARALTGDDISGGTITSFASTGIDDNAASTAITIDSSQDVTFTSDAKFPDNGKAIFGAGSDLQIYHTGSDSRILDNGTGNLRIMANNLRLQSALGEQYIIGDDGGAVTLYYDNAAKLATTATGIDVTGNIGVTGTVDGRDIATDGGKLDGIEASADVTDASNVAAAGAVMDGDFTANGFMKRTGAGTYTVDTNTYLTSYTETDPVVGAVSGIVKADGAGNISAAVAGTDYLASYTETDTLNSVTGRGATTTNAVTVGNLTSTGIDDNATSTAITIDSSENVGIGTSSPSSVLTAVTSSNANNIQLRRNSSSVNDYAQLGFVISTGTTAANGAEIRGINTSLPFPGDTEMGFLTKGLGSINERVRITNNGQVVVGTTFPNTAGYVTLSNAGTVVQKNAQFHNGNGSAGSTAPSIYSPASGSLAISANSAERMRIDSSGNLLVGYTSSNGSYKLQVNSQIFATSATIATSDGNYKENVTPLDGALSLVSQLNPVQFDWKEHPVHEFDRNQPTVGFIAQEVQQVLASQPYLNSIVKSNQCVLEPEETDEDGNITKEAVTENFLGIAEGNMIALLTKAIQEQQAMIEELKAEVAALKRA